VSFIYAKNTSQNRSKVPKIPDGEERRENPRQPQRDGGLEEGDRKADLWRTRNMKETWRLRVPPPNTDAGIHRLNR
jgi:hypothetical protein